MRALNKLLLINILIAFASLLVLYYFDYPIELIGATGIAWVLISSVETIRKLNRQTKKRQAVINER